MKRYFKNSFSSSKTNISSFCRSAKCIIQFINPLEPLPQTSLSSLKTQIDHPEPFWKRVNFFFSTDYYIYPHAHIYTSNVCIQYHSTKKILLQTRRRKKEQSVIKSESRPLRCERIRSRGASRAARELFTFLLSRKPLRVTEITVTSPQTQGNKPFFKCFPFLLNMH